MAFTWPLALVLLWAAPALAALYLWSLRRRRPSAVRWSSVSLLREALPRSARWKRHVPAALLVAAVAVLAVASARPTMARTVAVGRTSIILALDVSLSMCATDVDPNRLAAAQRAANAFVQSQPRGTRIGIVTFAGFAEIVVPPTRDRDALTEAIDGLTTARGTAIGAAMMKSLDAIAEVNPDVPPVGAVPAERAAGPAAPAPDRYVPDIVVLLTDGRNTQGVEPQDAMPFAVERRVRVYTIGFGTSEPAALSCTVEQLGGAAYRGGFGAGGPGGGVELGGRFRNAVMADDATLREVAVTTGGTFHAAEDAAQLRQVFEDLPRHVERQEEHAEVTHAFGAVGALLAGLALVLSMRWSPYP